MNDCDITAVRGEELIVIELKKQFSTDLLIQATDRQRISDSVYVALPVERGRSGKARRWTEIERLLQRLELGLILVHFSPDSTTPPEVEIARHPPDTPTRPARKPKARALLLREIAGRTAGDYNVGGVSKRSILTAYREQCIFLVCCLEQFGPSSPAALRAREATAKAQTMLHRDVYGWFERLGRGKYGLRPETYELVATAYPGVVAFCREKLSQTGGV